MQEAANGVLTVIVLLVATADTITERATRFLGQLEGEIYRLYGDTGVLRASQKMTFCTVTTKG
jgi:hypothetical protein